MMRYVTIILLLFALTGCDYEEVVREIGYKGKARVDPWLAAERFCQENGESAHSLVTWKAPDSEDSVLFMPASLLGNTSFVRQVEQWVADGGNLVLLVEHADAETNDWSGSAPTPNMDPVLVKMLKRAGIKWTAESNHPKKSKSEKIEFDGDSFAVDADSKSSVAVKGGKPGVFASVVSGEGRITVLTDARIFRNRWIAENDHAALLNALVQISEYEGNVVFMRGTDISLWSLLRKHLWPVLLGLAVLIILWLWKNFSRFGPIESATDAPALRGYDLHLEALGDFQWRLDKGAALLAPLRAQIVELGQRASKRAGRRDDDIFQFLADRAGIPRDQVFRALAETAPADAAILTRTTADLQLLLKVLH